MRIDLSPELRALVDAQVASGRFDGEEGVINAALLLLEETAPADGRAARSGAGYELAKLKGVHAVLQGAKLERDFVVKLTGRQRAIRHPEAILQITAEALGARIAAQRVGFFRVANGELDFSACWTDGTVRVLHGRTPLKDLGAGVAALLMEGEEVVTQNCRTDPAVNGDLFASLQAVGMICVPVVRDRQWEGGLYVHTAEARPWSVAEALLAREVAELTWDAVERAQLLERLRGDIGRKQGELSQAAADLRHEVVERKSAENQVSQLQKLDVVGQLTGGIAHDFNNMLAVVIGALNLMQRRIGRGETDIGRYVEAAMDGATRAAALTQRLLAFSRRQPLSPEPIDVNKLIAGMDEMLTRTLGEAVSVQTVLGAGLWATKADVSQLENAVLNLAVNARDAMAGGGRLTIETGNVSVDETYARQNEVVVGQYVLLAVTDTGGGMTPEVLDRVFEPFFTTKPVGKGTGLGLSQVFGFVRQSHGTVKVYSEVGHGTSVKLYLPRFYGQAEPIPRRDDPLAEAPRGDPREIILVVEDEDRVRVLAAETLRDLGYTVVHADSGPAALKMMDDGQEVDLLFTDIVMPDMTGRQLGEQALRRRPGLKVIYTTGYTRNAVVHNGVIDPGTNFLPKPFSIERLATLVRSVMDAA